MKIKIKGQTTAPECFYTNKSYEVIWNEVSLYQGQSDAYEIVGEDGYTHFVLAHGCAYLTSGSEWVVEE